MAVALLSVAACFAGCILVPIPHPDVSTASPRRAIEEKELAQIQPGKTTREDIVLRYGAPDVALKNQRIFVYSWDVGREHTLLIEFGEDNVVRRVALKEGMDRESALQQFDAAEPR